jgi:hypothetical protein
VISRRWDHPGKKEITLSIKGITPTLRIVVDPDVDGPALAATLTERLKACMVSSLRASVNELLEYQDDGLHLDCTREEVLLTAYEYQARHEANMQHLRELSLSAEFDAAIDNNPDNGKPGMWLVSGIRHSCVVNGVGTARDALDKAIASGKVGLWECCTVKYLDPTGPEVFPL